ncbi:MAG TPA: TIR domain-containing protein [Phototrophicaceae bacterium]|nr:TIR domain-containing protein [Phototrophicaceae bacterium]
MSSSQIGVFISYSHEDRFIAETLAQRLPKVGYRPWVDFEGIRGGDQWKHSIDYALDHSAVFLILLTPESVTSHWVKYEISRAQAKNCPIIPLLIRQCAIPEDLEVLQFVDFRYSIDRAFEELQRALLSAVVRGGTTDENPTEPEFPAERRQTLAAEQDTRKRNVAVETSAVGIRGKPLALVIEDQASTQNMLKDSLSEWGLDVHTAGTRNEATELIRANVYDFITLDMMLGPDDEFGHHGIYLLELLKRHQAEVPVVMITSMNWDKNQTAEFFATDGIKHLLDKPIKLQKLRALVEQYVKNVHS